MDYKDRTPIQSSITVSQKEIQRFLPVSDSEWKRPTDFRRLSRGGRVTHSSLKTFTITD